MYSINSFSDLLSQGQITEALQLRLEAIEASARHYRQDLEAAKVSSAALGVIGLLLSANPLVAVIAGCGLAGYGYTVLRDYQNTKRLCLLPLVRKGTGELLTGLGLAATSDQIDEDPLLGVIGYVEPELAHEYELVMVAEAQLTGYLSQLPGEARFNAFRHILRHTRLRNSLKLPPLQDVAVAIAAPVSTTVPKLPAFSEPEPVIEVRADEITGSSFIPSSTTASPVATPKSQTLQQRSVQSVRSAYTLILDNPFQSLAIFGAQRTGKSYLAAVLSQELHRRGIPIYAINLARYGKEDDAYWCHCAKSVLGDISEMRPYEANQLIEQAIDVVEKFYSQPQAILVFDEWAYAGNKDNAHAEALEPLLKLVADKLGTLTSTGIKRGKAIWTIAPEFVAGSLQQPAKAVKKSKLLYVTITPGKFIDWNGNKIGFSEELFSQVKLNFPIDQPEGRFAQERICYLNKEWLEMGDLPPLDSMFYPSIKDVQPELNPVPSPNQDQTAAMVEALTNTRYTNLWEFLRDEAGLEDAEEIKEAAVVIGRMLVDDNLTLLQSKFRIQSEYDVRYSYPGYSKKVAQVHRYTNNICSCCHKNKSKEAHHSRYLGIEDKPGINLFPVCLDCHKSLCHSKENWNQRGAWESCNTPEWETRLRLEFKYAAIIEKEND